MESLLVSLATKIVATTVAAAAAATTTEPSAAVTATTLMAGNILNLSSVDYSVVAATCNETNPECVIDHSVYCVGDPLYCNLTREEYLEILYDYISPTVPEWILIFSHVIVFLMGLVRIY